MGLLVFLMVFVAGEEISWGQRIFSFDTPDFMEDVNEQQEFGLHNLRYIHLYKDGLFAIGIFVWGVILPIAKIFFPLVSKIQAAIRMPLPPVQYVGYFAAAIGYRVVFKTLYGNAGQEGLEFLFALAMFLLSLHAVYKPKDLFELK